MNYLHLFQKKSIPFIVSFAMFMEAVDTTIINTAIPAMSKSLQINPIDLKVALISYLLSLAMFIPISGWLADKFGIKRVFIIGLAIFTLSSVYCGLAHNLLELVLGRALQGIGGSISLPVGRLIIVRTFQRHELALTMNRVIMVASLGMMLGPMLGGVITHHWSWHWIFWVNLPVGLFTILLSLYGLENTPPQKVQPLDKLGFIFFSCSLVCLTYGLFVLSEVVGSKWLGLTNIVISALLMGLYYFHSRDQKNPIVKIQLFQFRTFQTSVLGNLFSRLGFGGLPFLLPLLLQINLGYSAQLSGVLLAPIALGVLISKTCSLILLQYFGYKRFLIINTILVGLSLWTFMFINHETPIYIIVCMTFIFGFLIAMQYSGMNLLAYADVAPDSLSAATSFLSTLQQLAQSFGVAAAASLVYYCSRFYSPAFALTITAFHDAFFAMGVLTLLSIIIFIRLKAQDGHQLLDHPTSVGARADI